MSLKVKNLTHVYMPGSPFQSTAVNDVSLTIENGEFVGLIGHTGSGKSTLVQHFNGLLKPTSGNIYIDKQDINEKNIDKRKIRYKIGLVFQYPEHQLFEENVRLDIAFGPKNLGLSTQEIDFRVREACGLVGLSEDLLDKSPFELSGGQKRRVAIAGVIAMKPQVLILDEPTAGLDPRGREEILSLTKRLHEVGGATIIMVSHSMEDIAKLVDRIIVMNHGQIALDGKPVDVFKDADILKNMGLDVPEATKLATELRKNGWNIPEGIFKLDQIKAAILGVMGGKADA